jgi:hypothetical protein
VLPDFLSSLLESFSFDLSYFPYFFFPPAVGFFSSLIVKFLGLS